MRASHPERQPAALGLLGVPSSAGARRLGCEAGPAALRRAGVAASLGRGGREVRDRGDLPPAVFRPDPANPRQRSLAAVGGVVSSVADAVGKAVDEGLTPIVLGGDCTISIGVLAALAPRRERLGVIYLDGDLDLNTPETTPSGFFDGMNLAHIVGDGLERLARAGPAYPIVPEDRVAVFGFNEAGGGIDPYEFERLGRSGLHQFPADTVRRGPAQSAHRALEALDSRVDHLFVHFDVDVVDELEMPAVDVRHPAGLTLDEVVAALRVFLESPKWAGLVVTEFNGSLDRDGLFARNLVAALSDAFG